MVFDCLDERNAMVKSVLHFDNFTKWTFLVVNRGIKKVKIMNFARRRVIA